MDQFNQGPAVLTEEYEAAMSTYSSNGVVYYRKRGNIVEVNISDTTTRTIARYSMDTLGTLPEGYRPSDRLRAPCTVRASWGFNIVIEPSGEVDVYNESDGQKEISRIWCHHVFCV